MTFLLGCSFTAEEALIAAGLEPRHIKETGIVLCSPTKTKGAGKFTGPFVVSMRPYTPEDAKRAADVTEKYPMAMAGRSRSGVRTRSASVTFTRPVGEPVTIEDGEVPVFWACGVTPQEAIRNAKPRSRSPMRRGTLFVSDIESDSGKV